MCSIETHFLSYKPRMRGFEPREGTELRKRGAFSSGARKVPQAPQRRTARSVASNPQLSASQTRQARFPLGAGLLAIERAGSSALEYG